MFDDDDGDSYRKRKEASVSDLAGTTMLELVLVSTPIPTGIWLLAELKVSYDSCDYRKLHKITHPR